MVPDKIRRIWLLHLVVCEVQHRNVSWFIMYLLSSHWLIGVVHCNLEILTVQKKLVKTVGINRMLNCPHGKFCSHIRLANKTHCFLLRPVIKCRAHWHTCYMVIHVHVGVDDPKTCQVETSVQLPSSSSGAEKQSLSSTEENPGKWTFHCDF